MCEVIKWRDDWEEELLEVVFFFALLPLVELFTVILFDLLVELLAGVLVFFFVVLVAERMVVEGAGVAIVAGVVEEVDTVAVEVTVVAWLDGLGLKGWRNASYKFRTYKSVKLSFYILYRKRCAPVPMRGEMEKTYLFFAYTRTCRQFFY